MAVKGAAAQVGDQRSGPPLHLIRG